MRQGIVRAADVAWFLRGARWPLAASVFLLLFHNHSPIWADAALMAVCLYAELRDWSSRNNGYSDFSRVSLMLSIVASDWVVGVVLVFRPTGLLHNAWLLGAFVIVLVVGLMSEVLFQRGLAEQARTVPSALPPPFLAEYVLYVALPRREREPFLGDLKEDFETNVVPKFGPLLARAWYWYKTILCVRMYTCENAIEPLLRRVIEPLWRRVVWPLLKWIVAPALVVHKLGWADAIRAFADASRAVLDRLR